MLSAASTTTPFSPIPFSPLERPLSLSECQLHDAVTMLKSIKATFDTVDKRDSTRNGFGQLIQKVATYLYTFYEQKYRVCDSHLSLALTQLWIKYRDQVIRLLVDLDGVAKRQVRANMFQRKLGSFSRVSADVTKLNVALNNLSISTLSSLSGMIMNVHLSGSAPAS